MQARIFENQRPGDVAIVNSDDPTLRDAELPGLGDRVVVTRKQAKEIDWEHALLRGDHNLENAIAPLPPPGRRRPEHRRRPRPAGSRRSAPVRAGTGSAEGLERAPDDPHAEVLAVRAVRHRQGNPGAVHLILGGSLKGSDFADLATAVAGSPVAQTYLIGAAADAIAQSLDTAGVPFERSGTLAVAVDSAAAAARPGDTVLLSPACASFDQFRDYEHRGDTFRRLVQEVAGAA